VNESSGIIHETLSYCFGCRGSGCCNPGLATPPASAAVSWRQHPADSGQHCCSPRTIGPGRYCKPPEWAVIFFLGLSLLELAARSPQVGAYLLPPLALCFGLLLLWRRWRHHSQVDTDNSEILFPQVRDKRPSACACLSSGRARAVAAKAPPNRPPERNLRPGVGPAAGIRRHAHRPFAGDPAGAGRFPAARPGATAVHSPGNTGGGLRCWRACGLKRNRVRCWRALSEVLSRAKAASRRCGRRKARCSQARSIS